MQAITRRTSSDGGSTRPHSRVPLSRRFTYRYLLALFLLAVIAILWTITMQTGLQRITDLTAQQKVAAQQPTRLANVVNLAQIVSSNRGAQDALRAAEGNLTQQASGLSQSQHGLSDGDTALGVTATANSKVISLYKDDPTKLNDVIDTITNAAKKLAETSNNKPDDTNAQSKQLTIISDKKDDAAKGLETALKDYTDDINAEIKSQSNNNLIFVSLSLITVVGVGLFLFRPMARNIHFETTQLEDAERVHRENNGRQTFRNELSQALEVTDSEGEVLAAVGRAFLTVVPDNQVELLLRDASGSHLRVTQVSPTRGGANCPVDSPQGCAAIRRGQSVVYESSRMLNVCPKLPEHDPGVCSAVCVPVMFMGNALGVLHTVGPDGQPPSHTEIERLSVLASETGNRLGLLRHSQDTELQATTDGLTGLFNRRTLESKTRGFILDKQPFSIAMADLDHFKKLNDQHGHEAGDRALRMFAGVLRSSLRPEDISARYGGEEFIVLLPHTSIAEAIRALDRLREALAAEVSKAGGISFTASWGLTDSASGTNFDEIVAVADAALYSAKRAGRDCMMVDGQAAAKAGYDEPTTSVHGVTEARPQPDVSPVNPVPAISEEQDGPLMEIDMDLLDASRGTETH